MDDRDSLQLSHIITAHKEVVMKFKMLITNQNLFSVIDHRRLRSVVLVLFMSIFILFPTFSSWADPPPNYKQGVPVGDPIMASSGKFYFDMPLLDLGGPLPLTYQLEYLMDNWNWFYLTGMFGPFWSNLNPYAYRYPTDDPDGDLFFLLRGGRTARFTWDAGTDEWVPGPESPVRYQLLETGSAPDQGYYYVLDPVNERLSVFQKTLHIQNDDPTGRIIALMDRNGNRLDFSYSDTTLPRPTRVEDGLGRALDFSYVAAGYLWPLLDKVTDQTGREISYGYNLSPGHCGYPVVESVTDAEGHVTTFQYACPGGAWPWARAIEALKRPLENIPYSQTVEIRTLDGEDLPRVTSQSDAYDNTMTLTYAEDSNRVTETRADGEVVVYEHYHNHGTSKSITDPAGNTVEIGQSNNEQINEFTDRMGDTTTITHHEPTGRIFSYTNAKGQTTEWVYEAQEQTFVNPVNDEEVTFTFYNLIRINYPDQTFEIFEHDEFGNVLKHTNRGGETWSFTYNEHGQVLKAVNPAGGESTYTYNLDATLASSMDSDIGATIYEYDEYKRVKKVFFPDQTHVERSYDLNDRITAITNENGQQTRFEYDANGNLIKIFDPDNKVISFEYDLMDRIVKAVDRLGEETFFEYDWMGRVVEFVEGTGVGVSVSYDSHGWVNELTRGGKTWTRDYDHEGVPVSVTTPMDRIMNRETDKLGLGEKSLDALGNATILSRDAMNRVTSVTNPLNLTTQYNYDVMGRIVQITLPTSQAVNYTYNNLGLLEQIADFNNSLWTFTYTDMGRLESITDPLNRTTHYSYSVRGRKDKMTLADGETLEFTMDGAGNTIKREYSGGLSVEFEYDSSQRPVAATHLALTRDDNGRIIATSDGETVFGAGYDAAGRLKSADYNKIFKVDYEYDAGQGGTGLLTSVRDNLTNIQIDFFYDDDRRLHKIELPNGETITNTWNDADKLTKVESGNHVQVSLGYDAAGRIIGIELDTPLDPREHLSDKGWKMTYDAASQISGQGYVHDLLGRVEMMPGKTFTWDGFSRLTGINDVTLTYNGLGQIRTRTDSQQDIHYYYNHGIIGAPVVAEKDRVSGQMLRYYVWTPGGRLLYMVDAADNNKVYFYHFDQVGSTLALTDMDGQVTDAWAYDPYGLILTRIGNNPQPFTYVGEYGVRQEGDDGLYQMQARYYDAGKGRFLSPEPVWPQTLEPVSLNPYQYVGGDPLGFIDPSGLSRGRAARAAAGLLNNDYVNIVTDLLVDISVPLPATTVAGVFLLTSTPLGYQTGCPEWGPQGPPLGMQLNWWVDWQNGEKDLNDFSQAERKWIQQVDAVLKQLDLKVFDRVRDLRKEQAWKDAQQFDVNKGRLKYEQGMIPGLWVRLGPDDWVFFANARITFRDKMYHPIRIMVPVAVPGEPKRINLLEPFGISDENVPPAGWVDMGNDEIQMWLTDHLEVWEGWGMPN